MKLLVFAHVPPPHHGQSYAVKLMLERFGGDRRRAKFRRQPPNHFGIECYHVNARFSKTLEDVGEFRPGKIALVLFYCLQAVWCRFRYGVDNFYYVPAPGKAVALYRDWLVMLICRPFFKRVIFNWHAVGLGKWLETAASIRTRAFTYHRMKDADMSIVLSEFGRRDAEKLMARRVVLVAGGIPDPCPDFAAQLLPRRRVRAAALNQMLAGNFNGVSEADKIIRVLFLAHCTREKGLFDAVVGVMLANEKLAVEKSPLRFRLTLIGAFPDDAEKKELSETIQRYGLHATVEVLGFVSAERKFQALRDADLFCFPTYYLAEGQPANLIEALAFGLPAVATRWRAIPEMLPPDWPGLVDPKSPAQIAAALRHLAARDLAGPLRELFLRRFTVERHLAGMAEAIRSAE